MKYAKFPSLERSNKPQLGVAVQKMQNGVVGGCFNGGDFGNITSHTISLWNRDKILSI